jgi:hypothetical protein
MLASGHLEAIGFNPLLNLVRTLAHGVPDSRRSAVCCAILALFEGSIRHQLFETREDCFCADDDIVEVVGAMLRALLNRE